jgi:predicted nuclease with TOPRIM domain
VREQKAGSRAPKEAPADEAADLRAQVASLRQKVDSLEQENAELRELLSNAP